MEIATAKPSFCCLTAIHLTLSFVVRPSAALQAHATAMNATPPPSLKPPFLFRAASTVWRSSRGLNTADKIDPLHGSNARYHSKFAAIPYERAKEMVKDHISFYYDKPSELSSWSVSLLYVLVHATRKAHHLKQKDVIIYVMDTKHLDGSRLHSAVKLLEHYDIAKVPYRDSGIPLRAFVDGEYFIHGKIEKGRLWEVVELDQLLEDDELWNAVPGLKKDSYQQPFMPRLKRLRARYFGRRNQYSPLIPRPRRFESIKNIAMCFRREWWSVIIIALISNGRCYLSREDIAALRLELKYMKLPDVPFAKDQGLRTVHREWKNVPEAQQFMRVLRRLLHNNDILDQNVPSSDNSSIAYADEYESYSMSDEDDDAWTRDDDDPGVDYPWTGEMNEYELIKLGAHLSTSHKDNEIWTKNDDKDYPAIGADNEYEMIRREARLSIVLY